MKKNILSLGLFIFSLCLLFVDVFAEIYVSFRPFTTQESLNQAREFLSLFSLVKWPVILFSCFLIIELNTEKKETPRWKSILASLLLTILVVGPHMETSYINGFFTTIKWMAVFLGGFFAALYLIRKDLPRPTGLLLKLFIALIVFKVIATLLNINWVTMVDTLYFVTFMALTLAFQLILKERSLLSLFWFTQASFLVLLIRSSYLFVSCRLIGGNIDPVCFSGSFGNINMICEFLLLALPLISYYLDETEGKLKQSLSWLAIVITIFFLLAGFSRSAMLGICLWAGLMLISWKKKQLIALVIGGILFTISNSYVTLGDYAKAKEGSFSKRSELYFGASRMLLDSPLGLGPGEFEYNYVPYQRDTKELPVFWEVYTSPHSEILKWGTENGWAFLLVTLGILAFILWVSFVQRKKSSLHFLCLALFMTFSPHIAFQFPFDNSMGFIWAAFYLALFLNLLPQVNFSRKWIPTASVVVSVLTLWHFGAYSYSRFIESRFPTDHKILTTACEAYPMNWKACFWRAKSQLMSSFPSDATQLLKEELQRRPFNFEALFFLAQAKSITPDLKGTCEMVKVYDFLFSRGPELDPAFYSRCTQYPMPIQYKTPAQFRADFVQWLAPHIFDSEPYWPWNFNPQIVRRDE